MKIELSSRSDLYADASDIILGNRAAAGERGIKKSQVDSIAHRTSVDDALISAVFYELAKVLAWRVIDRCGLRKNWPRQFITQPLQKWEVVSHPSDIDGTCKQKW